MLCLCIAGQSQSAECTVCWSWYGLPASSMCSGHSLYSRMAHKLLVQNILDLSHGEIPGIFSLSLNTKHDKYEYNYRNFIWNGALNMKTFWGQIIM